MWWVTKRKVVIRIKNKSCNWDLSSIEICYVNEKSMNDLNVSSFFKNYLIGSIIDWQMW
jgi:hypothetical protein